MIQGQCLVPAHFSLSEIMPLQQKVVTLTFMIKKHLLLEKQNL